MPWTSSSSSRTSRWAMADAPYLFSTGSAYLDAIVELVSCEGLCPADAEPFAVGRGACGRFQCPQSQYQELRHCLQEHRSLVWSNLGPDGAASQRSSENANSKVLGFGQVGGDRGTRTPDLVVANDALSQLSYIPMPILGLTSLLPAGGLVQSVSAVLGRSSSNPSGRSTIISPACTSTLSTTSLSAGTSRSRESPRSTR